ncbi:MAG: helix-turn-helix transcriptional regulator [Proteobacteria bacterium]|nr:helix-turn-helix transcriptional regulator [Pseudomonadota bacterium]
MNTQTLKALAEARNLSQADIGRYAGVSRQAVSQWFKTPETDISIGSLHLKALADAIGASADDLLRPLPLVDKPMELGRVQTQLLWDRLYPSVPALAAAAVRGEAAAIARLVQSYGLYATADMLGAKVWRDFPAYKTHLIPARRRALEAIWQLRQTKR